MKWPALTFHFLVKLQKRTKSGVAVSTNILKFLCTKIALKGVGLEGSDHDGIAYLLSQGEIKRSLVPLFNDSTALDFYETLPTIHVATKVAPQEDLKIQRVSAIAMKRLEESAARHTALVDGQGAIVTVKKERNIGVEQEHGKNCATATQNPNAIASNIKIKAETQNVSKETKLPTHGPGFGTL